MSFKDMLNNAFILANKTFKVKINDNEIIDMSYIELGTFLLSHSIDKIIIISEN